MNCSLLATRSISECSGHGVLCLKPEGVCQCDLGWSGTGDFWIQKGIYCDVNTSVITVMCIISIIVTSVSALLSLRYFAVRCIERKKFCSKVESKFLFPVMFLLYKLCIIFWAIVKISNGRNQPNIGSDLCLTISTSILSFFLFAGFVFFYFIVIGFLKDYLVDMNQTPISVIEKFEMNVTAISRFAWLIFPLGLIIFSVPSVGLAFPQYQKTFAKTFLIGTGVIGLIFITIISFSCRLLLVELYKHIKNVSGTSNESNDLKRVYDRLNISFKFMIIVCTTGCCGLIAFGCIDFLLSKTTYLLLILQITMPIVLALLLSTISRHQKNERVVPIDHSSNYFGPSTLYNPRKFSYKLPTFGNSAD